ncbi:alpha/beta hydrolase [Dyella japonica]|uniref:Carboxylesterase n=1 Tax=Dyella japonica A8 TaxID=1217721 RepID=A0A075JYA1_9GAMM|nr:alpha/beta hydrolase [Dyella japonica]AIF46889.1 carboxylesterase [Dyella japonica A8]
MPRHPSRQRLAYATLGRWLGLCVAVLLGGCEATLFAGLNTTDQHKDLQERRGIEFDADHHLALDVYTPAHAEHAPVVVFFYGGDWTHGERAWYRFVGTALAARGVTVVVPDYRKVPQVGLTGFMQDAANAVAWAHAHAHEFGGNADDMFVMGHSAGGQISALLATDPSWLGAHGMHPKDLAGFIGLAGCYDFVPVPADDQDMIGAFGPTPEQQRQGEPVAFVQGAEPPMLLLQGIDDHEVEPSNAISMNRAMVAQHEEVTLKLYPGVGHEILLFALSRPLHGDTPILGDILDFIEMHPAAQPMAQSGAASR